LLIKIITQLQKLTINHIKIVYKLKINSLTFKILIPVTPIS